jgi:hypothetical protein
MNSQGSLVPQHTVQTSYTPSVMGGRCVCVLGVQVMLCSACGAELILTNVIPDDTVAVRGVENHTFICSACHVTEHRVVFIKAGRETDGPPMPRRRNAPSVRQQSRISTLPLPDSSAA